MAGDLLARGWLGAFDAQCDPRNALSVPVSGLIADRPLDAKLCSSLAGWGCGLGLRSASIYFRPVLSLNVSAAEIWRLFLKLVRGEEARWTEPE